MSLITAMKTIGLKTILLTLLLACVIFLPGCAAASPAASPTVSETAALTPLPSVTGTPLPSATPSASPTLLPTDTPTPSPTLAPHYDLHDVSTWPEDMRAYFERNPSEWNHPTQEYMSDDEFHNQLINMRRDFVADLGVEGAEVMNEQELFYEYVHWGMENKQILTLSPHELRAMLANPANAAASYKELNNSITTLHEGLFTLNGIQANISNFEESLQQLFETRLSFSVFGELITLPRMAYNGFVGNQAGLFRLPGVDPEVGVGILGHWNPNPDEHAWIPLTTHFSSHQYQAGDIGIYFDQTVQITQDITMVGAHTGPRSNAGEWLTLQRLVDNIGRKIHAMPDYSPDRSICGGFPWQMGLEGAQQFDFPDGSASHFPPVQYPWTP